MSYPESVKRLPKEDQLSSDDWGILASIMDVMHHFKDLTKKFETRGPLFSIIIPSLHRLIDVLREKRVRFNGRLAFDAFEGLEIPESNIVVSTQLRRRIRTAASQSS